MDNKEITISFPKFASQVVLNKEENHWFCSLVAGDYKNSSIKGYEVHHGKGDTPQSAVDSACKTFDFNTTYWQTREKPDAG